MLGIRVLKCSRPRVDPQRMIQTALGDPWPLVLLCGHTTPTLWPTLFALPSNLPKWFQMLLLAFSMSTSSGQTVSFAHNRNFRLPWILLSKFLPNHNFMIRYFQHETSIVVVKRTCLNISSQTNSPGSHCFPREGAKALNLVEALLQGVMGSWGHGSMCWFDALKDQSFSTLFDSDCSLRLHSFPMLWCNGHCSC